MTASSIRMAVSHFHHYRTNRSERFAEERNHISWFENFWN